MPNYNTLFEHKLVIRLINDIILIKKKSSFFTNLLRLLNLDTIKFSLSIGFMHLNPSCTDLLLHRCPSITPLIKIYLFPWSLWHGIAISGICRRRATSTYNQLCLGFLWSLWSLWALGLALMEGTTFGDPKLGNELDALSTQGSLLIPGFP